MKGVVLGPLLSAVVSMPPAQIAIGALAVDHPQTGAERSSGLAFLNHTTLVNARGAEPAPVHLVHKGVQRRTRRYRALPDPLPDAAVA